MNSIRLMIYFFIIFTITAVYMFEDFTGSKHTDYELLYGSPDFHTFKALGIRVETYPPPPADPDPNSQPPDILLLRTSQINRDPTLERLIEGQEKNIIFVCDEDWQTNDFLCTTSNFISKNPSENVLIDSKENINVGYIEEEESRYFVFPELLVNNVLRYHNFLNLTSSISNSQNIEETIVSNNIEIGKQSGISFFPGAILAVFFLYLGIIYLLNTVREKLNIKQGIIQSLIPFVSLVPFILAYFYTADSLPYLKEGAKLTIEEITGVDPGLIPNSVWLLAPMILLLIGFEFNILLLRYKTTLLKYTYNRLNPNLIKLAVILLLSTALFFVMRNTESVIPQTFLNSLFFAFFLFMLYQSVPSSQKEVPPIYFGRYSLSRIQKDALKIGYIILVVLLCISGYYYGRSKINAKNKIFFDPPKQYFTVPYSKLIKPYEIYHEYNVESSRELFIDDFIVSHPNYEEIDYSYRTPVNEKESFGYLIADEENSIKPVLNDQVLKTLETDKETTYFRFLDKGDLDSKVTIDLMLKCTVEQNADVKLGKFRLSYDKTDVISSFNTIYTKRKCIRDEEYKLSIVLNLDNISSYAFNNEILKLSSDSEILSTKITVDDPNTKLVHLNLNKEDRYIFYHAENSKNLQILSADVNADNMKFMKVDNKINLGESFNLLKQRNLISSIVTIDSINKYTLIKYIK